MTSIIDRYLDHVLLYANKSESESQAIRQELKDHLLQKAEDLAAEGLPREEAAMEALRQHGSPRAIGYRLRAPFPWIDIRTQGTAHGVIAIGPCAIGIFAFGGWTMGVFALGFFAGGVFSAGMCVWGLFCFGGHAMIHHYPWTLPLFMILLAASHHLRAPGSLTAELRRLEPVKP